MKKKVELDYSQKLTNKSEWWQYFGEYQYCVDLLFKSIIGGQITVISLPLAFLIRHTLELGFKMNLLELEKVSNMKAKIAYKGKTAHSISDLHCEFENQMKSIFSKYNATNEIIKEFDALNIKLKKLNKLLNKLDEFSYAFRYPVKCDGKTPNFDTKTIENKTDVINFKEIKELYDDSIILIKYSTDVVNDIVDGED